MLSRESTRKVDENLLQHSIHEEHSSQCSIHVDEHLSQCTFAMPCIFETVHKVKTTASSLSVLHTA